LLVRGRRIPVVLPSRRDPRLKLSVVIVALQVLGQTVLDFKVSIAQILVTIGVCAAVELAVTGVRERALIWPASAILTGNSVAFILRASGTRHGDWWTLHGIEYFVAAALIALLSKYLIRPGGRHVFNPSNAGLVWVLLVIGPVHVFPQYLWWGPIGAPVGAALAVILLGAIWILRSVRMVGMALAFLVPFTALVGIFAAAGQSFLAIWHDGPVSGLSYWSNIVLSPEVLIFVFFMMSDPRTAPRAPRARMAYGALTAVVAAGLLGVQPTEFGIKVAILASLTVSCALVPLIERGRAALAGRSLAGALRRPAVVAVAIVAVAAPIDTLALASNEQISLIERGLTGTRAPQ
jgi:Na+-translocating ferredoxin:NAD+ oxidoreductase RnfD subunit